MVRRKVGATDSGVLSGIAVAFEVPIPVTDLDALAAATEAG